VLLSHAGGFLPYVASRISTLAPVVAPALAESLTQEALRSFWFDTALSGSPYALPSLLAFADPDHVTFGSDWPHAPLETARQFTDGLDLALPEARAAAVARDNAETLFPRLTARKASAR
jgi:predicted TIM-barrel fold metal-dependent hydrolase